VAHEECLERQRPVGLLQLQRKERDCVLAAYFIDLGPVIAPKFFRADQRLWPQREVQMVEFRRGAVGTGIHTIDSLADVR
jgi:hypothetical protein